MKKPSNDKNGLYFTTKTEAFSYVCKNHATPVLLTAKTMELLMDNIKMNVTKSGRKYYTVHLKSPTKPILGIVGGSN